MTAGDRLYLAPHGFLVFLFQLQLSASVYNRGQPKTHAAEDTPEADTDG